MADNKFIPTPKHIKDLTGQRFDHWLVLGYAGKKTYRSGKRNLWTCRCDCGTVRVVQGSNLKSGESTACGCTRRPPTTHGMSDTPAHNSWRGMLERCTNPNHKSYKNYGGRGIKICQRWQQSFEAFYDDMGDPPSDSHSLDRINNNGPYTPENCRWATARQQGNNSRWNHLITFNGETLTMKQWANRTGIKYSTLAARLNILGWSVERALTEPVKTPRTNHG